MKKYKFKDAFGDEIKANTHTFLKFSDKKVTPKDFYEDGGKAQKGYLLDHQSNAQMSIVGDERIFSRKHTRKIVSLINKKPSKENIMELGRLILEIVNMHKTQKQEFVSN